MKGYKNVFHEKRSTKILGDLDLIPGLGRSPTRGHGNPLQYSCMENPHGQRILVGYNPWGCNESDMTEQLRTHIVIIFQIILIIVHYI